MEEGLVELGRDCTKRMIRNAVPSIEKVKTINVVSIKSRGLRLTDRREHGFAVKQAKAGVEALRS